MILRDLLCRFRGYEHLASLRSALTTYSDGSKRLQEAALRLDGCGYDQCSIGTLSELRLIVYSFGPSFRRPVAWGVHRVARTPEFLDAVIL